jgi:predicted N-acetyltransferase YhbS
MDNIKIRAATMEDCPAIVNVHRGEADWWADLSVCEPLMAHRLGRGFYNHVAYADEKIVGHGEWIIDDGFNGKFLYLGMLQIDPDFQRRGIGNVLVLGKC